MIEPIKKLDETNNITDSKKRPLVSLQYYSRRFRGSFHFTSLIVYFQRRTESYVILTLQKEKLKAMLKQS